MEDKKEDIEKGEKASHKRMVEFGCGFYKHKEKVSINKGYLAIMHNPPNLTKIPLVLE